jgi:hypothetical protein
VVGCNWNRSLDLRSLQLNFDAGSQGQAPPARNSVVWSCIQALNNQRQKNLGQNIKQASYDERRRTRERGKRTIRTRFLRHRSMLIDIDTKPGGTGADDPFICPSSCYCLRFFCLSFRSFVFVWFVCFVVPLAGPPVTPGLTAEDSPAHSFLCINLRARTEEIMLHPEQLTAPGGLRPPLAYISFPARLPGMQRRTCSK